jgi:hypothetical protein
VIADVVQYQHQIVIRPGLADLGEKGGGTDPILRAFRLPLHLSRGVVQGTINGDALIGPGGRYPHRLASPLPDLCQVGVGMQVALSL